MEPHHLKMMFTKKKKKKTKIKQKQKQFKKMMFRENIKPLDQ